MRDVRPYVCTIEECNEQGRDYASQAAWIDHELTHFLRIDGDGLVLPAEHELEVPSQCLFCGDKIATGHGLRVTSRIELPCVERILSKIIESRLCQKLSLNKDAVRGQIEAYVRHVGRHLEETAFAVVTKTYDDWEFYSDLSSRVTC